MGEVMTIPALLFGFIVASLYGALYHLICGGGPARLFGNLVISWLGFALGHFVGTWCGWILFPVGPLDFGAATVGSLLLLALSLVNFRRPANKKDAV
jgi:hypothetical protein